MLATHAGLRKCVWSGDRTFYLAIESKMATTSQISSSRIARRAEQGARPAIPTQVAVDKLATECKCKCKCKCKNQIKSNQYQMYL